MIVGSRHDVLSHSSLPCVTEIQGRFSKIQISTVNKK